MQVADAVSSQVVAGSIDKRPMQADTEVGLATDVPQGATLQCPIVSSIQGYIRYHHTIGVLGQVLIFQLAS